MLVTVPKRENLVLSMMVLMVDMDVEVVGVENLVSVEELLREVEGLREEAEKEDVAELRKEDSVDVKTKIPLK